MSDTPRTDALHDRKPGVWREWKDADFHELASLTRELERELRAEQEKSMMAGSQLSALRLQIKDAEQRAARYAANETEKP